MKEVDQHLTALRYIKSKYFDTRVNMVIVKMDYKEVKRCWKSIIAIDIQYDQLCIHVIRISYLVRMMTITCAYTTYMNYLE